MSDDFDDLIVSVFVAFRWNNNIWDTLWDPLFVFRLLECNLHKKDLTQCEQFCLDSYSLQ